MAVTGLKATAEMRLARTRPQPPPARAADGSYAGLSYRYLEWVSGGAGDDEALPMVVAIHGHDGDPQGWVERFKGVHFKARFIAPFGDLPGDGGKGYQWFVGGASEHQNLGELEEVLPPVEASVAASLVAIRNAWPTVGKLIVTGFSQGAVLSYSLALRHGDDLSVACPMSGLIPKRFLQDSAPPRSKPDVHAFHGDADHRVALGDARRTIKALQRLGFRADLKVLPGLGHKVEPALTDIIACVENGVHAAAPPGATP
jgi:phospholipase/carboxylesterase